MDIRQELNNNIAIIVHKREEVVRLFEYTIGTLTELRDDLPHNTPPPASTLFPDQPAPEMPEDFEQYIIMLARTFDKLNVTDVIDNLRASLPYYFQNHYKTWRLKNEHWSNYHDFVQKLHKALHTPPGMLYSAEADKLIRLINDAYNEL